MRTATLSYDAVALVAALVKTQGTQRFTEQVLTNSSGFAGIDGVFRFRPDGTNERGLAVLRVAPGGRPGRSARRRSRSGPDVRPFRKSRATCSLAHCDYAARSATTASSTGKPEGVTRRRPSAVVSTAPSSRRIEMRAGSSVRPASAL